MFFTKSLLNKEFGDYAKMNNIYFDKLYSKNFVNEPAFISIPFKKGELFDSSKLQIFDGERSLPLQQKITGKYSDGSIKYIFNRFLVDLEANKKKKLHFSISDTSIPASFNGVSVSKTDNGFEVNNQCLTFEVKNDFYNLFSFVKTQNDYFEASSFIGPKLTSNNIGSNFYYKNWKIEEQGDICVILSCDGYFGSDNIPGTIKLTVYAFSDYIDTSVILFNAFNEPITITDYYFEINIPCIERAVVASSNYKTDFQISNSDTVVRKEITAASLLNQSNEHFSEVFYGTFFADVTGKSGICATIFQAHQNFPKAVEANTSGLKLYLVPESPDTKPVFMPGMAREQRFQLFFHDKALDLQEINHQSTVYQMPNRAILDSSVYEESGIFPDIFVHDINPDAEYALINCADSHARGYGILNFGDTPDPNYTNQGRGNGELVWTNNEYDFPHACMLMFAKTGTRRFLEYLLVSANHQIDVDVCHYSDDPLLLGGQWEHTNRHCSNGVMVCSHQWVEGILDCYHITGDSRYYDTAIGIGNNILRLLDTPMYSEGGTFNARETGWALRSLTALYLETGDEKWNSKSEWIVNQFKDWFSLYGGWLAPYLDNVVIRVPFMISVAVGSLMRYYRVFPEKDIRDMLISAVDDLIENCILDNGLFFYKELPSLNRLGNNPLVLEALAIAYELTNDSKYLKAGIPTFKKVIANMNSAGGGSKRIVENTVLTGNTGSKQFAQSFIPVATYYKALEKASL